MAMDTPGILRPGILAAKTAEALLGTFTGVCALFGTNLEGRGDGYAPRHGGIG